MDPLGHLPPNYELYSDYLRRLIGKEAAPPLDMVKLLSLVGKKASLVNVKGEQRVWVEVRRAFNLPRCQTTCRVFFLIQVCPDLDS